MKLEFEVCTNKDYVMVNTVKFKLKSGSVITVDRKTTEYRNSGGMLSMTWSGCYLWAINERNIFGEEGLAITDPYAIEEFKALVKDAEAVFELEDDADSDYRADILDWIVS